jgi:hypothetical protein
MLFNDKKCKAMHIGDGAQHVYKMGNHDIEKESWSNVVKRYEGADSL